MEAHSAYHTAELAAVYDAVYADVDDSGFWMAMAAEAGGTVLELGCGTGRVLLPLARAGHRVVGLDASSHMLERCRARLEAEPPEVGARVELLQADMTSFDLGHRVAAIFCAFNSFHHLRTVNEQLACLERCRAHLAAGGLLVLDLFNPDPAPDDAGASTAPDAAAASSSVASSADSPDAGSSAVDVVDWTEGRRIRKWVSRCDYDRRLQCNEVEMTYEIVEADGARRRISETFPLRLIYRYELEHLLARCGFSIATLYGGYDRSEFSDGSLGMIAVARRDSG